MQTPFEEIGSANNEGRTAEWAARSDRPKRSVFGNYAQEGTVHRSLPLPGERAGERASVVLSSTGHQSSLQAGIDAAVARAFVHRFLACAFADPALENWIWLSDGNTRVAFQAAARVLTADAAVLTESANALAAQLSAEGFESFQIASVTAFGHAARGSCPLNEIEYGDIKADPLFQPHRLADLAAFYRAFGLEVAADAAERHDHISLELEFMCVLAAKEAYTLEHQLDPGDLSACRDAQKNFLREHLGRWVPAFARRLAAATSDPTLKALAIFTRAFVESECARFGVRPGSEELLLRPVDENADRMCDSCGVANLPPGALAST